MAYQLGFTLFRVGDCAEETPGVAASISSTRTLFPLHFASIEVEDVRVDATVCAGVGVSISFAVVQRLQPFRRVDGFGFAAAFPLGNFGVQGEVSVILGTGGANSALVAAESGCDDGRNAEGTLARSAWLSASAD
jgi:hypothetical protein